MTEPPCKDLKTRGLAQGHGEPLAEWGKKSWVVISHVSFFLHTRCLLKTKQKNTRIFISQRVRTLCLLLPFAWVLAETLQFIFSCIQE
jgi:hypothetical protein